MNRFPLATHPQAQSYETGLTVQHNVPVETAEQLRAPVSLQLRAQAKKSEQLGAPVTVQLRAPVAEQLRAPEKETDTLAGHYALAGAVSQLSFDEAELDALASPPGPGRLTSSTDRSLRRRSSRSSSLGDPSDYQAGVTISSDIAEHHEGWITANGGRIYGIYFGEVFQIVRRKRFIVRRKR